MPSRNVVKINASGNYYHVCTRGISNHCIFLDEADYRSFLSLLERCLSKYDSVEVLAYCLMPNHFHLLLYEINKDGAPILMHSIMASYSRYFNQKYERNGPLFESDYKIVQTLNDKDLLNISRDIHLSSNDWIDYPNSSLRAYFYDDVPCWLSKSRIAELCGSAVEYLEFLEDYQKARDEIVV